MPDSESGALPLGEFPILGGADDSKNIQNGKFLEMNDRQKKSPNTEQNTTKTQDTMNTK